MKTTGTTNTLSTELRLRLYSLTHKEYLEEMNILLLDVWNKVDKTNLPPDKLTNHIAVSISLYIVLDSNQLTMKLASLTADLTKTLGIRLVQELLNQNIKLVN